MKLIKLLANLGYGSRREVERLVRKGVVTDLDGQVVDEKNCPAHDQILLKGEPLDPEGPLLLVMNKPDGYTCSLEDPGDTIYDLLPARFALRNPVISSVGRLDKDTTGLLLLTDDGKLLHQLIHPKSHVRKVYHAVLDRPLEGHEAEIFASGELMLNGERKPLLPAGFEKIAENEALITLHEGRYHQIRRMFAAVGNHVLGLKRIKMGGFDLPDDLPEGEWRIMSEQDLLLVRGKAAE